MLYKYLERQYMNSWINGGLLPLKPATSYLAQESERKGNLTPDEGKTLKGDGLTNDRYAELREKADERVVIHARLVKLESVYISHFIQDTWNGLVLCFSTVEDRRICTQFDKYDTCILIPDEDALFAHISAELGVEGRAGNCKYTEEPHRDVFQKSTKDGWQQEYRMFWPVTEPELRWVSIPAGTAHELWTIER